MSTIDVTIPVDTAGIRPRPTGFFHDTMSVAGRALRAVPRLTPRSRK